MDLHPDRLVKRKSGYPEEPTEYTSVTFYVDSPEILDTVLKEMERADRSERTFVGAG